MKRQKQLIKHAPDNGKWGDCYRTCIAIVMGMEAKDVPHFCDGEDGNGLTDAREWLLPQGLGVWQNIYTEDTSLAALLQSINQLSPGVPVIITGKGTIGVNHCVVAIDGEIFCDPKTGTANPMGLTGPAEANGERYWWIEVITKLPEQMEQAA